MKPKNPKPFALLMSWAGRDRWYIYAAVILALLSSLCSIVPYFAFYQVVGAVAEGICTVDLALQWALIILIAAALQTLTALFSSLSSHRGAYNTLFKVRCMVTEHMAKMPLGALDERSTGEIKVVMNESIEKLELFLAHNLPELVLYLSGPVVMFAYLLTVSVPLALVSVLPLLFVAVVMAVMFTRFYKFMPQVNSAGGNLSSSIHEYVGGMRLIKAFHMGSRSFQKFSGAVDEQHKMWGDISRATGPLYAAYVVLLECGVLLLVPLGGWFFVHGQITAGVLLLFAFVGSQYLTDIRPLQELSSDLSYVLNGVNQVKEILDTPVFTGGQPFPKKHDIEIRNVFQMTGKLKWSIFGVVLEGLLTGANFLALFQVLGLIFDGTAEFQDILRTTGMLAGIFVLRLLLYTVSYTGSQIGGSDVSRRVRIAIGDKLKRIPLGQFTKNRTGFYINAATSEVADFEQILTHKVADILKYSILLLAIGLYTCYLYLPAGIAVLASSLLLIPASALSLRQVRNYGVRKNRAREENVSAITEYLSGSQTLRSYALVGMKNETLTQSMKEYSDISYHYEKAVLPIGFGFHYCSTLALAFCIVSSVRIWLAGALSPATLVILVMLTLFVGKVNMVEFIALTSYRNLTLSRNKIQGIFREDEEPEEAPDFSPKGTEIRFQNVDFSYVEGEPVLQGASFTIPEGKLTAIVGDSGAGKSTVLNLISKYHQPQAGRVTIGGQDIRDIPAEQVLTKISLVDQDVFLFNDTVRSNIRYARPSATDQEVEATCRLANCDGFIRAMEQGYDTEIGENGNRLSGGERQRLSVARAILKDSPILLLDEATASLDIENELLVKQAVSQLLRADKTVVMIAHTLPIVKNAGQILVLDAGHVAEAGTHDQLVAKGGKYAAMWEASRMLK